MERVSGAGAAVQAVGDSVEFVLTVDREVRAFRQILPQQPVGVFASTALPGTVRVAEVHLHAGGGGEFPMARHFFALVVSKACCNGATIELSLAEKPASADAAVASSVLASSTRRLVRSTRTPTEDWLLAPLMKSPSQWPGSSRSSISGGRTWILTMSGICPRRSVPRVRGMRVLWPWRRQAMS